jgi:hypothetical protein
MCQIGHVCCCLWVVSCDVGSVMKWKVQETANKTLWTVIGSLGGPVFTDLDQGTAQRICDTVNTISDQYETEYSRANMLAGKLDMCEREAHRWAEAYNKESARVSSLQARIGQLEARCACLIGILKEGAHT